RPAAELRESQDNQRLSREICDHRNVRSVTGDRRDVRHGHTPTEFLRQTALELCGRESQVRSWPDDRRGHRVLPKGGGRIANLRLEQAARKLLPQRQKATALR